MTKTRILNAARRLELESGTATELAENVAHELDHDEWLDEEDHYVWEAALLAFDEGSR